MKRCDSIGTSPALCDQPLALRAFPFHGKGVDGLLIPLLSPSSGRRWRIAPEVGFALFRLRPTPCPSGIPLPWEGGMGYSSRFSLLPLEGGGAQRRRLASLSFVFDQPPALRASPFHRKGVDFYHFYLLPQKGDRWLSPFSLLPLEGGAPKGRWLASAAD